MNHIPPVRSTPPLGDNPPPLDLQYFTGALQYIRENLLASFQDIFTGDQDQINRVFNCLAYANRLAESSKDIPPAAKAAMEALIKDVQAYISSTSRPSANQLAQLDNEVLQVLIDTKCPKAVMPPDTAFSNVDQATSVMMRVLLGLNQSAYWGLPAPDYSDYYHESWQVLNELSLTPDDFPGHPEAYQAYLVGVEGVQYWKFQDSPSEVIAMVKPAVDALLHDTAPS